MGTRRAATRRHVPLLVILLVALTACDAGIDLPDISLPDITLPDVSLPDVTLPELPDVELPDVELPDLEPGPDDGTAPVDDTQPPATEVEVPDEPSAPDGTTPSDTAPAETTPPETAPDETVPDATAPVETQPPVTEASPTTEVPVEEEGGALPWLIAGLLAVLGALGGLVWWWATSPRRRWEEQAEWVYLTGRWLADELTRPEGFDLSASPERAELAATVHRLELDPPSPEHLAAIRGVATALGGADGPDREAGRTSLLDALDTLADTIGRRRSGAGR